MTTGFRVLAAVVLLATVAPVPAHAAAFSLTGVFLQDDEVALIPFTVETAGDVVLRTLGYGGGLNAAGDLIAPLGFDPVLTLFGTDGWQLVSNDDAPGGCASVGDPGTGFCQDARIETSLAVGTYLLALTQWLNPANGPTIDEGFLMAGAGNYTGPGGFWDAIGTQRTGFWAVDITTPDPQPVPEPGTLLLLGAGLIAARCARRHARPGSAPCHSTSAD